MSEIRKLGFAKDGCFIAGDDNQAFRHLVTGVPDAEVADLLARVLEAAGKTLPRPQHNPIRTETCLENVLWWLSNWRAALARDAAKAEEDAERECAWVDYRKDYGVSSGDMKAAHKAFLAGWKAAHEGPQDGVLR